ncbi:MAG: hypothetical protein ACHRXM_11530 [Isosphaerales bacterium]
MSQKTKAAKTPTSLAEVIRRLNPNVPAGFGPVGMPRTPRDSNAMRQVRTHVTADPFAKVLLTGHIGVGKSTELLNLSHEMKDDRFVIWCSIAKTLGAHNADTFSLLVAILEASIRAWIEELGDLPPGLVEELVDHIRDLFPANKRPRKSATAGRLLFEPAMTMSMQRLERILGGSTPKPITGQELSRLYSEMLQRLALRHVAEDQLAVFDVSSFALSCEVLLKELASSAGKPVLLVIDDLDKIRNTGAQEDVFLDRAMAWMRLPCAVAATLPFEALFSPRGRELDHVWGDVHILDPLPIPELPGRSVDDQELKFYLAVLRSVNAQDVFSGVQCRKLAHLGSGLPRAFVNTAAACVRYAIDAGEEHIRDYHLDLVQQDLVARTRGRLNDSDYEALVAVLDTKGSNVPKAIQLLRDDVLIRDGNAPSDKQFRLASWVEPLVREYRSRTAQK